MRFIETKELKALREQGLGPWRVKNNALLRTSRRGQPLKTPQAAQDLFDVYATAWELNVESPEPIEVVEVPGGYGVLVEYVQGVGLSLHIILGSYSPQEAGAAMGDLARRLHAAHAFAGLNWNEKFRDWARGLAPLLPEGVGSRLAYLVSEIPESHALLHGDLHTGNVVVRNGGLVLIDMESVGFGHPVLDLAIMRSRLAHNCVNAAELKGMRREDAEATVNEVWSAALQAYFRHASTEELRTIDDRILVLAEVEHACFSYRLGSQSATELTTAQRVRLASLSECLCELMPKVDKLFF